MTPTPQFGNREPSSEAASRAMRGNRASDTKPEMLLRRELWRRGHRYRLHRSDLPGRPDLAFVGQRVAVFCDGDFWHGRDWEERKAKLRNGANSDYWIPKIRANRERDRTQTQELEEMGWAVIRMWESDITGDPEGAADVVAEVLSARS